MNCPECGGRGYVDGPIFEVEWHGKTADLPSTIECPKCSGTGTVEGGEDETG